MSISAITAHTDLELHTRRLASASADANDPMHALQEEEEETDDGFLQRISRFFSVEKTQYGGRGCFATRSIKKNTKVLSVGLPVGSSIVRPFRKEVCFWCFRYDNGKTMKWRHMDKLYLCSAECLSELKKYDSDGSLASVMCAAEDLYVRCAGHISEDEVPATEAVLLQVLDEKWNQVHAWETSVFRMKPSKRARHFPTVTVEDYNEIRYVLSTLHTLSRYTGKGKEQNASKTDNVSFLQDMPREDALRFEVRAFECLQSSEMDKMKRYPYLVVSYTNIYKFVRLVCPENWLHLVTPRVIRAIIGRNLTNAFGIWSPTTQEDEEREFFGFGVYPSASFFNHSCAYNITKVRTGASYDFIATKDILPGEELCISYGINGDETVEKRRESLREWFFICGCNRCKEEAAEITEK